jgi:hypothetical protein
MLLKHVSIGEFCMPIRLIVNMTFVIWMKTIVFTLHFMNSFGTWVIPSIGFFQNKNHSNFFLNDKKIKVGC